MAAEPIKTTNDLCAVINGIDIESCLKLRSQKFSNQFEPHQDFEMGSLSGTLSGGDILTAQAQELRLSATLEINELVKEQSDNGKRVVHLGFGEATFPIARGVRDAHQSSSNTSYLPVAGLKMLREVSLTVHHEIYMYDFVTKRLSYLSRKHDRGYR